MVLMTSESNKILSLLESGPVLSSIPASMPSLGFSTDFGLDGNFDNLLMLLGGGPNRRLQISDMPSMVMQQHVFRLFGSKDLFKLRMVCTEWNDLIKTIWCQVVKDEMLE